MAKQTAVAAEPVSAGEPLTLTEFCTRLSATERRVELIGAFEADERRAGRLKDTAEQFGERFQAFITKPV